jgi:hypothetical protein
VLSEQKMIKKEKNLVTLKVSKGFLEKINALKKYYRVQTDAELVRILINEKILQPDHYQTEAKTDAAQNKKRPPN